MQRGSKERGTETKIERRVRVRAKAGGEESETGIERGTEIKIERKVRVRAKVKEGNIEINIGTETKIERNRDRNQSQRVNR